VFADDRIRGRRPCTDVPVSIFGKIRPRYAAVTVQYSLKAKRIESEELFRQHRPCVRSRCALIRFEFWQSFRILEGISLADDFGDSERCRGIISDVIFKGCNGSWIRRYSGDNPAMVFKQDRQSDVATLRAPVSSARLHPPSVLLIKTSLILASIYFIRRILINVPVLPESRSEQNPPARPILLHLCSSDLATRPRWMKENLITLADFLFSSPRSRNPVL
jgi:hypothetical protein